MLEPTQLKNYNGIQLSLQTYKKSQTLDKRFVLNFC